MTVYTPNIPQPGDNPSDSQDQILENFQTLQTLYGTSGDHYSWTNTNPPESTKHAKVTTPGLPTATAPGNVLPAPTSGNCSYFGQTRGSQTYPYIARDGLAPVAPLTNIWPLLPIKAYANIAITSTTTAVLNDSFNITSVTVATVAAVQNITINITNAMRTNTYGVVAQSSRRTGETGYSIVNQSQFIVNSLGATTFSPYTITVFVLES